MKTIILLMILTIGVQAQTAWSQDECLQQQSVLAQGKTPLDREKAAGKACAKLREAHEEQQKPLLEKIKFDDGCQVLIQRKINLLEPEFKRFKPFGNVNDDYIKAEVAAVGEIFQCYQKLSPVYAQRFKELYEQTIFYGLQPDEFASVQAKAIHPAAALNPDSKRGGIIRKATQISMDMKALSKSFDAVRASLMPIYFVPVIVVVPK